MILLSADTSGPRCVLALSEGVHVLAGLVLDLGRTHGKTFFTAMEQIFSLAGRKMDEVEAIGCVVGPGSFTGLRIAVTACKVIAFQRGIPVYPLSSLAALAEPFWGKAAYTAPAWDARNQRVFAACYDALGSEVLAPRAESRATWLEALEAAVPVNTSLYLLGAMADWEDWSAEERKIFERNPLWVRQTGVAIEPGNLARLTARACAENPGGGDPMALNPAYLVASQAERMSKQKPNQPLLQYL